MMVNSAGRMNSAIGNIIFVAAAMCWAVYSVLARKYALDALRGTVAPSRLDARAGGRQPVSASTSDGSLCA